ncbi:hypothetical protein AB0L99_18935 [Streptomyces sp. NPDC051954]|uniref:hypothetical protein n=1 Tax=unclassified Streptomyces TaxID=2593676 RepID=UPI00343669CF
MTYLAWPVAVCCVVALMDMVMHKKPRSLSAGYWIFASLVFAAGFPAYYWSEPRPLWARRAPAADGGFPMSGRRVMGAALCWAALGGAVVVTMALLRGFLG